MSHTEQESASDALKRHFASRMTNQVRVLLNRWRAIYGHTFQQMGIDELLHDTQKLIRHCNRFDSTELLKQAQNIEQQLQALCIDNITPASIENINTAIYALGQSSLRKSDSKQDIAQHIPSQQPVFLAVGSELANTLTEQLDHFDIKSQVAKDAAHLIELSGLYDACAFIVDIHFDAPMQGIELMKTLEPNAPMIFLSTDGDASLEQRLAACRAGGSRFFINPSVPQLIRSVESFYANVPAEPYKVLVVDDSRSQALFCDKALSSAGMLTHSITDPMQVLNAIEEFEPEIIVMDMYMPGCTGTELAAVIRQQPEYLRIPIIFLSAEEDKDIQLSAMDKGDDFLTKPVDPGHLATTVGNRGQRARVLNNLIVRDSLTGLYNHTHILDRLQQGIRKAQGNNTPLCFAMVDIDFFKRVNDNYGHPVGDKVISSLSLFLKQRLRKTDSIGRYGGEEFAVILPDTKAEDAINVMNNIREVFSQLVHSSNTCDFKVSFSCGICSFDGKNQEKIVEYADEALYEAKKQGRNNVQIYLDN